MNIESENKNIPTSKKPAKKRAAKKSAGKNKIKDKNLETKRQEEFVSISKSVGTASVIMTALVVTVTPGSAWILGPIIGAMCILGVALAYFATK